MFFPCAHGLSLSQPSPPLGVSSVLQTSLWSVPYLFSLCAGDHYQEIQVMMHELS